MNPDSFFESDPWEHAIQEAGKGALGRLVAVAVQATCLQGLLNETTQEWMGRLDALLGAPVHRDTVRVGSAVSTLMRYPGPVLVRLFVDERGSEDMSSFEVVGTDGLLVWKPDVRALSIIESGAAVQLAHEDVEAARLKGAAI